MESFAHPEILVTSFANAAAFDERLLARIRAVEQDRRLAGAPVRAFGGTKIYHLDQWESPEADLLDARVLAFSQWLVKSDSAVIDLSWANVYRSGDYAMPHSHERTTACLVYGVDPGDPDPSDQFGGQLMFIDPRIESCCGVRGGAVTTPQMPFMTPGTMILFPSPFVHCVNPYRGSWPRITLAWNIDKDVVPGSPLVDFQR